MYIYRLCMSNKRYKKWGASSPKENTDEVRVNVMNRLGTLGMPGEESDHRRLPATADEAGLVPLFCMQPRRHSPSSC